MRHAALLVALVACGAAQQPKTPASMLAFRLQDSECRRTCPIGEYLPPVEPQDEHVLDDCCTDPFGLTWSSCAWNSSGRHMTRAELMDPKRLGDSCGGDGLPDCMGTP